MSDAFMADAAANRSVSFAIRAAIVAWACAILLAACGLGESREDVLARIDANLKTARYRAAIVDLKNMVRAEPQDARLRLQLAEALLETGDAATAVVEARRARDLGAPPRDSTLLLARALLEGHAYEPARMELEVSSLATSADAHARHLYGRALLGLARWADARTAFETALGADPRHAPAHLGLAAAVEALEGLQAAKGKLDEAARVAPQDLRVQLALAGWHLRTGDPAAAREAFASALASAERDSKPQAQVLALAALGELALSRADIAEAEQRLGQLEALAPKAHHTLLLRARTALAREEPERAQLVLQELLAANPRSSRAAMLMGAATAAQGRLAQAEMYLASAVTANPDDLVARKLLADVQLRQNRPKEALLAAAAPEAEADRDLLALAGRASLLLGDAETAIDYFRRSQAAAPEDVERALALAAAYLSSGRAADALAVVGTMEVPERLVHRRELIRITALVQLRDVAAARAASQALAASRPGDDEAALIAARGLLGAGDAAGARALVRDAAERRGDEPRLWVALGLLELSQQDLHGAAGAFDAALRADPRNPAALVGHAQIALTRGDASGAIERLETARRAAPKALAPRMSLARLHLDRGETDRASIVIEEARSLAPTNPDVRALGGHLALARRDSAEAIATFEALAKDHPNVPALQVTLARAYASAQRADDARRALERSLEIDGAYWPALVLATTLAIASDRTDDAERHVARLRDTRLPPAALMALRGDIAARRRDFASATRHYDEARVAEPSRVLALKAHAARRVSGVGDAEAPLREWLHREPRDLAVRFTLAQDLENRDRGAAMREYRAIIEQDPHQVPALNNLAWLTLESGAVSAALPLAERAYRAAGTLPAVADTYGWALVKAGRATDAVEILRAAQSAAEDDPEIRWHLATALLKTGSRAEARTHLQALVESNARLSHPDEARAQLETLRGGG